VLGRRHLDGAGMTRRVLSPRPKAVGGTDAQGLVEREADAIVAVLRREGPLSTRTLRARLEARTWGPGRFAPALRRAVRDGRVRRAGRRTWAAVNGVPDSTGR
jgi:hypothetical protein